jgi:imidazolonepropionase-like amidohydrolase
MGWGDRVGALAPGRFGDLIAVRGDPLADITLLERVDVVVKGGDIIKHEAVTGGGPVPTASTRQP